MISPDLIVGFVEMYKALLYSPRIGIGPPLKYKINQEVAVQTPPPKMSFLGVKNANHTFFVGHHAHTNMFHF